MPYKNDNLEELFQKAANDYPLRTNSSNWNSVATKLHTPAYENAVVKKNNAWKYAAILLFLMTGGALLYFAQYKSTGKTSSLKGSQANSKTQKDQKLVQSVQPPKQNLNITTDNSEVLSSSKTKTALTNFSNNIAVKSGDDYLLIKKADNKLKAITNSSASISSQVAPVITQNQNQLPAPSMLKNDNAEANQNVINDASIDIIESSKTSVIKYQQPSKFYGSLYAGPEFSIIKSQHINSPGFKAGIALAYKLNKRFDIEIGLQREWINYFTNGQYFDKRGLNIKQTVELESLNAKSCLTSVPVTLRYNFASSKNSGHFYTGVGFNTLVLTHTESYRYTVNKNGNENDHSKNYKSVTGPKYFTSINTNIGYQNKLNNWCNFKVEPYYEIPVGNLGVGKLPVTSFGINVGIVKNLK